MAQQKYQEQKGASRNQKLTAYVYDHIYCHGAKYNINMCVYIAQLDNKTSYYLLVVLSSPFAPAFVVYHHATELALVFAGLLPHDGSAGGGGAAGHGCCIEANEKEPQERRQRKTGECEDIF